MKALEWNGSFWGPSSAKVHIGATAPNPDIYQEWVDLSGNYYIWDGEWWFQLGAVNGADGREVEMQTTATHIQWRYTGDTSWTNLLALSSLGGGSTTKRPYLWA